MYPLTFGTVAAWLLENPIIVETHLTDYFTKNEGRYFEYFIEQSDPFQFTPWDFLAISALSINPRASTMAAVLASEGNHLNIALAAAQKEIRALPADERSLWAIDARHLHEESTLSKLYYLLRVIPAVGPTTASKLLSTKFAEIVPIRDSKVALLLQGGNDWWTPMREVMCTKELRDELSDVSLPLEGHTPSLLRRLDVVLWMEAASRGL